MTRQPDTSSFSPFRELSDSSQPCWVWDSEQGTILWANARGVEFWGESSLSALLNQKFDHAMPGLCLLKKLGRTKLPDGGITEELLFWTKTGVQNVLCQVRKIELQNGLNGILITASELPSKTGAGSEVEPNAKSEKRFHWSVSDQSSVGNSEVTSDHSGEPATSLSEERRALTEIASLIRGRSEELQYAANQNDAQIENKINETQEPLNRDGESSISNQTEFLAKVSHEVRTPLNSIIGFTELMAEERFGPIDNPKYIGYLNDIHASAEHALSLIKELLDISKIQSGEFELDPTVVDVTAVVEQCVRAMQPQAQKARALVRTSLLPDRPHVTADQRSIKQILLNLLSNSLKFTEPGGQVIVSTQRDENGNVTIRVQDTGIGMSREDILIAMKPFQQPDTTYRKHDGTGLGLPLAKALAEANKASFKLESEIKKGTRVDIVFPKDLCV